MVYIIVEGITDKALVINILSDKQEKKDFQFIGLKGIDSVKNILKSLSDFDLSQHKYFAIVDADNDFEKRNNEMQLLVPQGVEYYILPNHKDNGDLETALFSIIGNDNKIIQCFETYESCVEKSIGTKAKLYAYTTLEHNQKPEEYILTLNLEEHFSKLQKKLQNLFN